MSKRPNLKSSSTPAVNKRRASSLNGTDLGEIVAAKVADIEQADSSRLKEIWTKELGVTSPPIRAYETFRRMVAWRVQEKYLGGLSQSAMTQLDRLVVALDRDPKGEHIMFKLKPGYTLVREWKGGRHLVKVLVDGFIYEGVTYNSLSEIARLITGTRWSGPLFFGLKKNTTKSRALA